MEIATKDWPFFVAGKSRVSGDLLAVENPYNGEIVGRVYQAQVADVEEAIQTVQAGFQTTRQLPRYARAEILSNLSQLIGEREEEIATLIATEAGKPLVDARGEVARAILNCQGASEEAKRVAGHEVPLDTDASVVAYQNMVDTTHTVAIEQSAVNTSAPRMAMASWFPLGPILAITPFNFPLNLALHKIAPAIAAGNSFILKPPPQTPLTPLLLGELLIEAGMPPEAFSVLPCNNELAERMVRDDRLKMVSFTGSARVGWHIKAQAGKKRVTLELGGNGGVVVDETADLDYAVRRCVRGRFVYAGQYCISVQRVFVQRNRYEEFLDRFVTETDKLRVGDPLEEENDMGSVIDEGSAHRIETWVSEAVSQGAKVLRGGQRQGTVVDPTILVDTRPEMKVEHEEIFGPVCTILPYDNWEEALARLNNSDYGLQAGVFTRDVGRAIEAFREVEAGGIIINDVPIYRIDNMPFGGLKDSGTGREGTRYAIESMMELKLMIMNP
jgi:acyl-CoA reductase-like NAD-dependent aldehyde dehydrogenase